MNGIGIRSYGSIGEHLNFQDRARRPGNSQPGRLTLPGFQRIVWLFGSIREQLNLKAGRDARGTRSRGRLRLPGKGTQACEATPAAGVGEGRRAGWMRSGIRAGTRGRGTRKGRATPPLRLMLRPITPTNIARSE